MDGLVAISDDMGCMCLLHQTFCTQHDGRSVFVVGLGFVANVRVVGEQARTEFEVLQCARMSGGALCGH